MGNQAYGGKRYQQAQAYGDVYVKLDHDTYFPGDTLSGTIYVNLRKPYPGDKLCFQMKGTEHAEWIDREARTRQRPDGTQETYHVDVPRKAKRDIIRQSVDVYDWKFGSTLPPGQFSFPFAMRVPDNVPGSFFIKQHTTEGEIRYRIKGFLKPDFPQNPPIVFKTDITIRERISKSINTTDVVIDKTLKTWCCIDKGAINVRSSFEKNAYAPSEQARIMTEIDNSKSQLAILDIIFQLEQRVLLRAGGHQKLLDYTIRSLNLGSLGPGQTCLGNQKKFATLQLPPGQMGVAKNFNGNSDPTQVLTPSTHGSFIQSDFFLKVVCSLEGCLCCDNNPTTQLPVQIYAPVRPKMPDPVFPAQWNPQLMPTANFMVNVAQPQTLAVQPQMMQNNQMSPPQYNQQMMQSNQMSTPQYNQQGQPQMIQMTPQGQVNYQGGFQQPNYNPNPGVVMMNPQPVMVGQNQMGYQMNMNVQQGYN